MVILDSNIFIYLANSGLNRQVIAKQDIAHASITRIEALGFSRIPVNELLLLTSFLNESYNLPLTDSVVERATKLRQAKKMGLGDSIIAATALEHGLTLWTANTDDFARIDGLNVFNPLTN